MALSNVQALDVVIGCIHAVSAQTPSPDETLDDGGIVDEPRLQAWKSLVVADPSLGVRKHRHEIEPSSLNDVSVDGSVQDAADVVRANAALARAVERAPVALPTAERAPIARRAAPSTKTRERKKPATKRPKPATRAAKRPRRAASSKPAKGKRR